MYVSPHTHSWTISFPTGFLKLTRVDGLVRGRNVLNRHKFIPHPSDVLLSSQEASDSTHCSMRSERPCRHGDCHPGRPAADHAGMCVCSIRVCFKSQKILRSSHLIVSTLPKVLKDNGGSLSSGRSLTSKMKTKHFLSSVFWVCLSLSETPPVRET